MDPLARAQGVVADLLERSRMPAAEAARRAALAADAEYWDTVAGGAGTAGGAGRARNLTIGTTDAASPAAAIADSDLRAVIAEFQDDGYFRTPPLLPGGALASLNRAIDAVVGQGWPPVFAWVYDQFWSCARLPAVARLIESRLGAGYAQIPHVWVHVVPATAGATGWTPHFDRVGRHDRRASVWLALTDATLDNGCMHLVPPRSLPPTLATSALDEGAIPTSDVLRALQATRALPAPAGSALGWGFDVLHWGGPCVKPGGARRAISMEFIAAAEPPVADEAPLVAVAGPLPALAERLRMVGQAICSYEKFEPGLVRYRAVAELLRAR